MAPAVDESSIEDAIALAGRWQDRANALMTRPERARGRKMARLMRDPRDKVILTALIDQGFRSADPRRVADQIVHLFTACGVPRFFTPTEKALLGLFIRFGRLVPDVAVPRVIARLRADTRHTIISGEPERLSVYLDQRQADGMRVNVNHLGEEVLGEAEARAHMQSYLADLRNPKVESIAIKISTICAQIHPLAFEETVDRISERLAVLYREAAAHTHVGARRPPPCEVGHPRHGGLPRPRPDRGRLHAHPGPTGVHAVFAGMALQAYLPDSFGWLQEITRWAQHRVEDEQQPGQGPGTSRAQTWRWSCWSPP